MEGKSAPPAMSPKPGSPLPLSPELLFGPSVPLSPPGSDPGIPPEGLGLPPLAPPLLAELELLPLLLDELEPALPEELELLDPELPLLELGELGPLAPPEGEDDPELEEGLEGEGTEGVVGVLADGQPINSNKTLTNAPVAAGRSRLNALTRLTCWVFITVAATVPVYPPDLSQKTTQSYQSLLLYRLRSEA